MLAADRRRTCILIGLLVLTFLLPGTASNAVPGRATVPTPVVSAAPPGTHGYPFPNTLEDIGRFGYVQKDVFIEGTARSYVPVRPPAGVSDGRWDATSTGPTAGYKTRLLVRYPENPARFNGTVVVEWLNVSAGYDSDSFDSLGEQFMRDGYAFVGVSAQAGGVDFLRSVWDAARYGSLSHPGDSYSYDIFSQATQAIRHSTSVLGALTGRVENLVAWGGSQSGSRLFTYVNSVQPDTQAFDAFVPFIIPFDALGAAPLSQPPLPVVVMPTGTAAVVRTDLPTPVLLELSESEVIGAARGVHAQPNSTYFRLWEHPGTSHANQVGIDYTIRRLAANGVPATVFPECGTPPINNLGVDPVYRSMLDAMHRWLDRGVAPARAPRVEMSIPADPTVPATIVRDPVTGIAKGGIRMPDVAVPTRTLIGVRPPATLGQFPTCFLFGSTDPWNGDGDAWDGDPRYDVSGTPEPDLAALYPSHAGYVAAVTRSAAGLVAQGFLLPSDAGDIIEGARLS